LNEGTKKKDRIFEILSDFYEKVRVQVIGIIVFLLGFFLSQISDVLRGKSDPNPNLDVQFKSATRLV